MSEENQMWCPWMKQICPGEEKCAPAMLGAVQDPSGSVYALCPIAVMMEGVRSMSALVYPLLQQAGMLDGAQPKTRDEMIRSLVKPDQDIGP